MDWSYGANLTMVSGSTNSELSHFLVSVLTFAMHAVFLFHMTVVLITVGCTCRRFHRSKTAVIYPCHNVRWLLFFALWTVLLFAVAEGVMACLSHSARSSQPTLYAPQALAFVTAMVAMLYCHYMEHWQLPHMSWLTLPYWTLAASCEILTLFHMVDHGLDPAIVRLHLSVLSLLVYLSLIVIELNLLRTKIFRSCGYEDLPQDEEILKRGIYYCHDNVSLPSKVSFWWLNWLLTKGHEKDLEMSDLGVLPKRNHAKHHYELFRKEYEKEKERAHRKSQKPSLWRTIFRAYGNKIAWAGLLKLIADSVGFLSPLAIGGIVAYATEQYYGLPDTTPKFDSAFVTVEEFFSNGFILVIVMFLSSVIRMVTLQYHYYIITREGVHMKTSIQTFVYEKSLHLSGVSMSRGEMTTGQITNHMSSDAGAIVFFFQIINYLWSVPYILIVTLILLYSKMSYAALVGASVILVTLPIQFMIGGKMSKIHKSVFKYSDDRLKKSNELLQGIRALKLYGWEDIFCSEIHKVRRQEVKRMFREAMLTIVMKAIIRSTPILMTLVSFSLYSVITHDPLTPEVAFTSVAFFNQLNIPLFVIPMMAGSVVGAIVSVNRLTGFFSATKVTARDGDRPIFTWATADDYQDDVESGNDDEESVSEIGTMQRSPAKHKKRNSVDDDRRNMRETEVTDDHKRQSVTPENESPGKEKMEMHIISPSLPEDTAIKITNGEFSWGIDPASKPSLTDVNIDVPTGKFTMITGSVGGGKSSLISAVLGEMVTKSGKVQLIKNPPSVSYGTQKAWLQNDTLRENILFGKPFNNDRYTAIIKACALQPDIDILPAGDRTEIGEKGINLSGGQKQRVSVARAMYADSDIVIMDDPLSALDVHVGHQLFKEGIMNLLIGSNRTVVMVTHHLQYLQCADKILVVEGGTVTQQGTLDDIAATNPELYSKWQENIRQETAEHEKATERLKLMKEILVKESLIKDSEGLATGKLIETEERVRGSVSWRVYLAYARAVRIPAVLFTLVLIAVSVIAVAITNVWLSKWSEAGADVRNLTLEEQQEDVTYYISGYAILSVSSIVFDVVAITCDTMFAFRATRRIHNSLLHKVARAPMRFFDTTPVGRILNRFSSDTMTIDQKLYQTLFTAVRLSCQILTAIIVNTIVVPPFIALVFPAMVGYYFVQKFFICSSRELQRLVSICNSPIFSHFSETLGGLSTVRAYRDERRFRKKLATAITSHNTAKLYLEAAARWLGVRLDFIGALILLVSGLGCMVSSVFGVLEPSLVGLSLAYALQMCEYLNWLVIHVTDAEMQMNAVERIEHYRKLPSERYEGLSRPPLTWPDDGDIILEGVCARYDEHLDTVLKNATIHLKKGQKIGICGRTGSGKSSLVLALFRMIDTFSGRILIDGLDISDIPLTILRRRLAIFPQDPVLFSGSVRFNLDPVGDMSDEKLWEVLEITQLKSVVMDLDGKLEAMVSEGGENFSVGQRQLFCLARAFLRKTKIIVMDEPTASVDKETDALIRKVVAIAFAESTVLTIAHRVSSILDSDTVLVLGGGEVLEYDSPGNLLKQEDSVFASLVRGQE